MIISNLHKTFNNYFIVKTEKGTNKNQKKSEDQDADITDGETSINGGLHILIDTG